MMILDFSHFSPALRAAPKSLAHDTVLPAASWYHNHTVIMMLDFSHFSPA
jgi:hypothetical protein